MVNPRTISQDDLFLEVGLYIFGHFLFAPAFGDAVAAVGHIRKPGTDEEIDRALFHEMEVESHTDRQGMSRLLCIPEQVAGLLVIGVPDLEPQLGLEVPDSGFEPDQVGVPIFIGKGQPGAAIYFGLGLLPRIAVAIQEFCLITGRNHVTHVHPEGVFARRTGRECGRKPNQCDEHEDYRKTDLFHKSAPFPIQDKILHPVRLHQ